MNRYAQSAGRPRFKNDCSTCRFLGQFEGADCYVCGEALPEQTSLIARFADDSSDSDFLSVLQRYRALRDTLPATSTLRRAYDHFFGGAPTAEEDRCVCGALKTSGCGRGHPGHSDYCPWRKR